jgi:N-acetylneuraminate synthase
MNIVELITNGVRHTQNANLSFTYIIAEAGVNHQGSMETAKRLVEEAAQGGADAIKFQSYKAETIASKDSPSYWDLDQEPTRSQYELFKKYDSFWKNEFEELKLHCDKSGIEFLSTPFDLESANFLNDLMPVFKISSSDITNKPFIEHLCRFGKPIILSTGASYLQEIEEAVTWIEAYELPLALLHCVLNYPTLNKDANLGMIRGLMTRFPQHLIGYSDHTLPQNMDTLVTAALLGAVLLEKHFTQDKSLPGNDHYHAMDMNDLKLLRSRIDTMGELIGSSAVSSLSSEDSARKNARRSLVAQKRIPKGKIIASDDLTWKRPASGISPKDIASVIGKSAATDIEEDETLKWELLDD